MIRLSDLTANLTTEAGWELLRNSALTPQVSSELVTTQPDRDEFLAGAELLRFHGPKAMPGRTVQPQQLLLADVLAAGHRRNAVLLPRRSSKSTTAIAVALGRAASREDYRVGILTLTTGKAGRSRFMKDVVPALERVHPDKDTRPYKIIRSNGQERVEWPNGSSVAWLSTMEDLRGEAFDLILLDEAGEPDPAKVQDVFAAALPTLDTRPDAQIVVLGTAGKYRKGNALWDWLEAGRQGKGGILEYAAPDSTSEDDLADWAKVEPLVLASHPGVGTLTTIDVIRQNWDAMTPDQFMREYLGIFGAVGDSRALINPDAWTAAGTDAPLPNPPERFGVGLAVHHEQRTATVAAAWRDEDGKAHGIIIDHRKGASWSADFLNGFLRQYKVPLAYDTGSGPTKVEVEKLERVTPRHKFAPQTFGGMKVGTALLVDEITKGTFVHYQQPSLDDAAAIAVKRKVGENGWLFGRQLADDDITPLEALACALHSYDDGKDSTPLLSFVKT